MGRAKTKSTRGKGKRAKFGQGLLGGRKLVYPCVSSRRKMGSKLLLWYTLYICIEATRNKVCISANLLPSLISVHRTNNFAGEAGGLSIFTTFHTSANGAESDCDLSIVTCVRVRA